MRLGWKFILPLSLSLFFLIATIILYSNSYPPEFGEKINTVMFTIFDPFYGLSDDDYMYFVFSKDELPFDEENLRRIMIRGYANAVQNHKQPWIYKVHYDIVLRLGKHEDLYKKH